MILQVQDYFFFQTGALDGIAVRQAGKPYGQVEKQGIDLFGTGCLRNLRCRCKTFQTVQMLQKTIRVGRNIYAGFSQTEYRKKALAQKPLEPEIVQHPVPAQAPVAVSGMRRKHRNLPGPQYSPRTVGEEFSVAGHAVKNLPDGKALRPPDRLLKVVDSHAAQQQGNPLPLAPGHMDRIAQRNSPPQS